MHQIRIRLGSAPDPAGGAYSAPADPLVGFKGPASKGKEERGREGEGRGKKRPKGKGKSRGGGRHSLARPLS